MSNLASKIKTRKNQPTKSTQQTPEQKSETQNTEPTPPPQAPKPQEPKHQETPVNKSTSTPTRNDTFISPPPRRSERSRPPFSSKSSTKQKQSLGLYISLFAQSIVDLFSPKDKSIAKMVMEIDSQQDPLTSEQKEIWFNCMVAIKDDECERLEHCLSPGSKKDRQLLRQKLLDDFSTYPYVIDKVRKNLAPEE